MVNEKALNRALKLVRNLIERLRTSQARPNPPVIGSGFITGKLGGIHFTQAEWRAHEDCAQALILAHGPNEDARQHSASEARSQLSNTLLRALRPNAGVVSRETFSRRVDREIRGLRRAMLREPVEWVVHVPVRGLNFDEADEAFTFGGVTFERASAKNARALAKQLPSFKRNGRISAERKASATRFTQRERRKIAAGFVGEAFASVAVLAVDPEAAVRAGVDRIQRAADAVNFLSHFVHEIPAPRRVFLAPDCERKASVSFLVTRDGTRASWSPSDGWPTHFHVEVSAMLQRRPATDPVRGCV